MFRGKKTTLINSHERVTANEIIYIIICLVSISLLLSRCARARICVYVCVCASIYLVCVPASCFLKRKTFAQVELNGTEHARGTQNMRLIYYEIVYFN